jgi:hypothetical protein
MQSRTKPLSVGDTTDTENSDKQGFQAQRMQRKLSIATLHNTLGWIELQAMCLKRRELAIQWK